MSKGRKKRTRGHGEGTIYQREDGRWAAQVSLGTNPKTGKRIRKTFSGKTRQEVATQLTKTLHRVHTGTIANPDKITLGEWLDLWVETYAKPVIRPSTYDSYRQLIDTHIKPGLGHIPLQKLQPYHIQQFYNERMTAKRQPKTIPKDENEAKELMEKMPTLSPATVKHMHVVLNQALKQAERERRIITNPANAVKPPKITRQEAAYLDAEQINKFLEEISKDRWYTVFLFAFGTGMRLGEVCALRWENVDLEKGIVRVRESVRRVKNDDPAGPKTLLLIQPPKTEKGKRTIPLPEGVLMELKKHKERQENLKLHIGKMYNEQGLVFTWENGRMIDPSYLSKYFRQVADKLGFKEVTFHNLRHSYASALLATGEHPKVVQELLGHSQVGVTLDIYSHVSPDLKERAAEKIDGFLGIKKTSHDRED